MAEWQAVMSSHEFSEWMAFFRIQPFGEWRGDFRMAQVLALTANVNRDPKKSAEVSAQDFMPDFEKALDEMEAQEEIPEHERLWNKVRTAFGGLVKRPTPLSATPLSPSTATSPQMADEHRNLGGEDVK